MLGHLTEMASRELRADALFVGIGAISLEHGLMNDSVPEIVSDRALRRMARTLRRPRRRPQVRPGRARLCVRARRGRHDRDERRGPTRDDRRAARARRRGHRRRVGGVVMRPNRRRDPGGAGRDPGDDRRLAWAGPRGRPRPSSRGGVRARPPDRQRHLVSLVARRGARPSPPRPRRRADRRRLDRRRVPALPAGARPR